MAGVIVRNAAYNYDQLQPVFFEIMDALAGDKIKSASHVLIKPNMLCAAQPEDAVITHPLIIKAAVEYVLQREHDLTSLIHRHLVLLNIF